MAVALLCAVAACSNDKQASSPPDLAPITDRVEASAEPAVDDAGPAAPSPTVAVDRFASAEIAGNHEESYAMLARADRVAVRGKTGWMQSAALRPALRSFEQRSVVQQDTTAQIEGPATFEPRLDEVVGLVPRRANLRWRAVAEDGGWRVAHTATSVEPVLPADSGAADAVRGWVAARQRCQSPVSLEYSYGLVGIVGLADQLCNKNAAVQLGNTSVLGERPNPSAVIAAFGPQADLWARMVEVKSPEPMHVVLAPFDDRWVVVGLLR